MHDADTSEDISVTVSVYVSAYAWTIPNILPDLYHLFMILNRK